MYKENQALHALFEPEVEALGYELWGIELGQTGNRSVLRIYIDKEEGIAIEDCVAVSHQITGVLDVEDPIKGKYELEVSSPGMDRPLFTCRQMQQFTGEMVKLRLSEKQDGRRRYKGLLASVSEDTIVINMEGEDITVPVSLIEQARLAPQF